MSMQLRRNLYVSPQFLIIDIESLYLYKYDIYLICTYVIINDITFFNSKTSLF